MCSDKIRKILCGDENDQSKNQQVINIAQLDVKRVLKKGKNVIIDATNKKPSDRRIL